MKIKTILIPTILLLLISNVYALDLISFDFETQEDLDKFSYNESLTTLSLDNSWYTSGSYSMLVNTSGQVSGTHYLMVENSNTSNINESINFSFSCIAPTAYNACHLLFNWDFNTNNGYMVGFNINPIANNNYRPKIQRYDNGVQVNIANALLQPEIVGDNLSVDFVMDTSGNMVANYYRNGNLIQTWSINDNTYTSGKMGLLTSRGGDYLLNWDNIEFTSGGYFYEESTPIVDRSFGTRRRPSKASRTATIEAPVELEPVKETSTDGLSDGQKLVVVALGGVVIYSIFTAKPKPRRIKRRKK